MLTPNGGVFGRNPKFNNVTVQGTLTAQNGISVSAGNVSIPSGAGISFAPTSDPSIPAVAATGFITRTATNVANNDTVTVGAQVYTFKTTLTPADYEVLIGVDSSASLTNLRNAINNSGGTPGTDYQVPAANASATASAISGTSLPLVAITAGTAGNSVALAETAAELSVSAATLLGGRDAQGMSGELLDDYEEGTWTPTYTTGAAAFASIQMNVAYAKYVKIGKQVTVLAAFWNTSMVTGSATGNLRVDGLPYAAAAAGGSLYAGTILGAGGWTAAPLRFGIVANASYGQFQKRSAITGSDADVTVADMNTTAGTRNTAVICCTYTTF